MLEEAYVQTRVERVEANQSTPNLEAPSLYRVQGKLKRYAKRRPDATIVSSSLYNIHRKRGSAG
jgi:hypothetical protein